MSLTTSEILERAAELIEPDDVWQQQPDDGHHCAASAIGFASGNIKWSEWDYTGYQIAYSHFARHVGTKSVANWNDAPGRTQSEVVQALRDAAAAARDASGGRA